MHESIIEAILSYLSDCPLFECGSINVDYLAETTDTVCYAISPVTDTRLKTYFDGSAVREYQFAIRSTGSYSTDLQGNLANVSFYEDLAEWIRHQNKIHDLPQLPEGIVAVGLEPSSGAPYDGKPETGKYELLCTLKYIKKGER